MKTLLIAFACIPLLAACKKDEPVPVTNPPVAEAPASTTMAAPADSTAVAPVEALPPATQSTEPSSATATPAPMPASGSSVAGAMEGSGGGMYVVASGDTLWSIAEKNGIAHGDLAKWNNINDPRELQVGRELKLSAQ